MAGCFTGQHVGEVLDTYQLLGVSPVTTYGLLDTYQWPGVSPVITWGSL